MFHTSEVSHFRGSHLFSISPLIISLDRFRQAILGSYMVNCGLNPIIINSLCIFQPRYTSHFPHQEKTDLLGP